MQRARRNKPKPTEGSFGEAETTGELSPHSEVSGDFTRASTLAAVVDRRGKVIAIDKALCQRLGVSPEEACGVACHALFQCGLAGGPGEECGNDRMCFGGKVSFDEGGSDANSAALIERSVPLLGADGHVMGSVLIFSEPTDKELLQERLEVSTQELDTCVADRHADLVKANELLKKEIGERKIVEAALRESEERFRAIAETAADCIYCKDRNLRYTYVNPAMSQVFGRTSDKLLGRTDGELCGAEVESQLAEVDHRVLAGSSVEFQHARPIAGNPLVFHDFKVPIRNSVGEIVGICGISRNITELRRVELARKSVDTEYASPAMKSALDEARLVAAKDSIVLLLGESGSGKDYLARYIHRHSSRSGGPFYSINCAALPPELAEAELFGHEAGAFTGARARTKGLLELAEGGTLLLNEIGELHLSLQAKLLSFLDSRAFTRVGGRATVTVNARLIAATNRDLAREVEEGRFRADLFYRLNVMTIVCPPLRDRIEDIPLLAARLFAELAQEMRLSEIPLMDRDQLRALSAYHWPGNVRELRNVLERAIILSQGRRLKTASLLPAPQVDDWTLNVPFPTQGTLSDVSRSVKRSLIIEALRRAQGSRLQAASLLGITRYALKRHMTSLGLLGDPHGTD